MKKYYHHPVSRVDPAVSLLRGLKRSCLTVYTAALFILRYSVAVEYVMCICLQIEDFRLFFHGGLGPPAVF